MRKLVICAVVVLVAVLGVVGTVFANGPAIVFEEDVTGDAFVCGATTYTITSGSIRTAVHEGGSASGNGNFTITVTPRDVVATDGTDSFDIHGAFWGGGAFNANTGGGQFTFTDKFQIVKQGGGTVDSVNVVGQFTPSEDVVFFFDFGTCESPE